MPTIDTNDSNPKLNGSLSEDLNSTDKTSSTKAMPARLIVAGIFFYRLPQTIILKYIPIIYIM
jgi:hypothetical protein